MGERKGVNKYYPPDYDPAKGGLNAFHGTHALRERARKLHEGILIIRFEMPYNIWCNGCGKHIGMGVRYNAQKRRIGNYYTTPIYKFRMKCHLCDQHFEIRTDPKNCEYEILSGCRRKEERWDTEAAGNVQTTHREVKEKLMTNAMYKLEHGAGDQEKAKKSAPSLTKLEELKDDWYDDFAVNQMLRHKFREEKKEIQLKKEDDDQLKSRANFTDDFSLLDEHVDDVAKSKRMRFGHESGSLNDVRITKRRQIKQASIFDKSSSDRKKIELLARSLQPTTSDINSKSVNMMASFGVVQKRKTSSSVHPPPSSVHPPPSSVHPPPSVSNVDHVDKLTDETTSTERTFPTTENDINDTKTTIPDNIAVIRKTSSQQNTSLVQYFSSSSDSDDVEIFERSVT